MSKGPLVGATLVLAVLFSPPVVAWPTDTPTSPMNLTATASADGTQTVLSWDPPLSSGSGPITGYNVYKDGNFLDWVEFPSFVDAGVDYTAIYLVTAENDYGEGLPSNPGLIILDGSPQCVWVVGVSPEGCVQQVRDACKNFNPNCPL